ncbi:MAG: NAD(P)-binding domain-containing protein [Myxococcota bacterium]
MIKTVRAATQARFQEFVDILLRRNIDAGITARPIVDKNNQSSRQGVYVIGDLVDASVIKVAFKQGELLGQHLSQSLQPSRSVQLDVAIIGAGPAGTAAAVALKDSGLKTAVFEKTGPFSSIDGFIRGKTIYAHPATVNLHGGFQFEKDTKEKLVYQWRQVLIRENINLQSQYQLIDIKGQSPNFKLIFNHEGQIIEQTSQVIILATGKRMSPNLLGVEGQTHAIVQKHLDDPEQYSNQKALVIGGGDSAIEAALALHQSNAKVELLFRASTLYKAGSPNRQALKKAESEGLLVHPSTQVFEISEGGLRSTKGFHTADVIFPFIGHKPPSEYLKKLKIRTTTDSVWWRPVWLSTFFALTVFYYCIKSGQSLMFLQDIQFLQRLTEAITVPSSNHTYSGAFWGTVLYSGLIAGFGVRAYLKTKLPTQKKRYLMLIGFQWVFLFGIPELLSPLLFHTGGWIDSLYFEFLGGMRAWKWYSLSVPWPLNIYALIDAPNWTETGQITTVILWLGAALMVTVVAIPVYVKSQGLRFCSYLCGCGGLAETLGDFWRELAPRGETAKSLERMGRYLLFLAVPITIMALLDAWYLVESTFFQSTAQWSLRWYSLMVDFGLASILGVGLYPYLGNRFWCRFFCPLRAYMEILAKRFSTIAIESTDSCIGCGECTRYCQMGIQVQRFAQEQLILDNRNAACIQCGVCIEVCPMEVLSIGQSGEPVSLKGKEWFAVPRAHWELTDQIDR